MSGFAIGFEKLQVRSSKAPTKTRLESSRCSISFQSLTIHSQEETFINADSFQIS